MSYGHQYLSPLQHPGYVDVAPGYGAFGGPAAVREPAVVRHDPLVHGGGGPLHDFHTGPHPKQGLAPHGFVGPVHGGPLAKDVGVNALPGAVHGAVQDVGLQRPPLRKTSYKPAVDGLVHGGFRAPLPKDVGIHDPAAGGAFHRDAAPNSPILGPGGIRPLGGFFNRRPTHVPPPHHGGFDGPFVGKGSFGLVPGAFDAPGGHKLSEPFLTPVARYSDGYAYHRVPLALGKFLFVQLCTNAKHKFVVVANSFCLVGDLPDC